MIIYSALTQGTQFTTLKEKGGQSQGIDNSPLGPRIFIFTKEEET